MSDNMETMDAYNVYTPPPGYGQPPGEPKKKNNNMVIIGIIVLIILCCCIAAAFLIGGWVFGDQIIEMLGIQVMRHLQII